MVLQALGIMMMVVVWLMSCPKPTHPGMDMVCTPKEAHCSLAAKGARLSAQLGGRKNILPPKPSQQSSTWGWLVGLRLDWNPRASKAKGSEASKTTGDELLRRRLLLR